MGRHLQQRRRAHLGPAAPPATPRRDRAHRGQELPIQGSGRGLTQPRTTRRHPRRAGCAAVKNRRQFQTGKIGTRSRRRPQSRPIGRRAAIRAEVDYQCSVRFGARGRRLPDHAIAHELIDIGWASPSSSQGTADAVLAQWRGGGVVLDRFLLVTGLMPTSACVAGSA